MDFTDLASCKGWLKIPSAVTTDDAILNALISQVTGEFLSFLSRDIFSTAYAAEKRSGTGQPRLTMKQFPVTAVSALSVNGEAVLAAPSVVSAGFMFDDHEVVLIGGGVFLRGLLNVSVSYTAGYSAGDPVLVELKNAATQQVAYEYMRRNRIGEKSKTLGNSQTVLYETGPFDPVVLGILQRHKTQAPVTT
jgi:hypothetical protein